MSEPNEAPNQPAGEPTQPSQSAQPGAQSATPAQPAGDLSRPSAAPTGKFSYEEDRSKWIPPHRLNEVSQKQQEAQRRADDAERRLRLSLSGGEYKTPDQEKQEQIKKELYSVLGPNAQRLLEMDPKELEQALSAHQQIGGMNEFVTQQWARHAGGLMKEVVTAVTDHIGGDLSPRAQDTLKASFRTYIEGEARKSEQNGELTPEMQRYVNGDKTLAEDFAKNFAEDWLTPARRAVTSQQVNRAARVPNSQGRSQQTQTQKPTEFKNMDERMDYAMKLFKERGGSIGGR